MLSAANKNFLNLLPTMIQISNTSGQLEFVNDAWSKSTGLRLDDLAGKDWIQELIHEDYIEVYLKSVLDVKNCSNVIELRLRSSLSPAGKYGWVICQSSYDADNSQWITCFTDITTRKLAKLETESESQKLFEAVLDQLPVGVIVATPFHDAILCNKKIREMWRNKLPTAEDVSESGEWEGFRPDGSKYKEHEWPLSRTLMNKEEVIEEDINYYYGGEFWATLRSSSKPVYDEEGNMIAGYVVTMDVTEKLKLEQERIELMAREKIALHASKMKSEFLANVSHEIRTPLNAIIGMAELLAKDDSLQSQQLEFANIIYDSGRLLLTVINDVLDFSKVEAGRLEIEKFPISLEAVLKHCESLMAPVAEKNNLAFCFDIEPGLPEYVSGDPYRLQQIVMNLISNALKFTAKGSVYVSASGSTNEDHTSFILKLIVQDTGIGMDESTISKLFTPFMQADTSTTRKYGGTGLGLSITKKLIDLKNGTIDVSSKLGKGTRFTVHIPFKICEKPIACDTDSSSEEVDPKYVRLLVAEDNLINQKLVVQLLKKLGFTNHKVVNNGKEAVEAFREEKYDVILMDCQMPVMDGYEATRSIRSLPNGDKIKIVALTASATVKDKNDCIAAGMNFHLAKPINTETLKKVLYHLC